MNKTRIFNEFKKGNICVFNDSLCNRDYLIQYAQLDNCIEESRAININTFKSYFAEDHGSKMSANSITRQLFVNEFLTDNKLSYFISDKYPESFDILSKYVSTILPSLKRVKNNEAFKLLPKNMISDINKLYDYYCNFLEKNGLFEDSFSEYNCDNANDIIQNNNYSIISYDTMPDLLPFLEKIGITDNLNLIKSSQDEPSVKIEKFDNCCSEVATQIRRIKHLLDEGINPNNIAITLASFDNQIDDVKREARKYNILLNSAPSSYIINYPIGKLFYNLRQIYEQRFSLPYMKSFLLDRSFPFKEKSLIRGLIRVAIDANIAHGLISNTSDNDTWELSLNPSRKKRVEDIELFQKYFLFYKTFKSLIINLNIAKTKEDVTLSLNKILDFLFDIDLIEDDSSKKCYSRVMDEFNSFYDSMDYCGIREINNLYGKIIDQIKNIKYEESIGIKEGINVYSYPSSSSLNIPYHFILGLNHEASEVFYTPLSILPPSIDEKYREEQDLTSAILMDYISSEYKPYISFSNENYSGSQLPPSFFIEHNLVSNIPFDLPQSSDSYNDEQLFFAQKKDSFIAQSLQSSGFKNASATVLTSILNDMANKKITGDERQIILSFLKRDNGEYKLSSTSIDTFLRCPYQWALKYIMGINEEAYDSVALDHREVGNFLHKVMEVFFKKVKKEDKRFFSSFMEKYEENLEEIFYKELDNYKNSDKSPSNYSLIYIEDYYKQKVMDILYQEFKVFDSCAYFGFETNFETHDSVIGYNEDGLIVKEIKYKLKGKVDKIIALSGEGYAIVDYKKGSATITKKAFSKGLTEESLKSYQFPCYRKLLKSKNMDAKLAAYYGFNDGKYEIIWDESDEIDLEVVDRLLQTVLENMLFQIEEGDFRATPSKDNCGMCNFRQVCRKRYSTK